MNVVTRIPPSPTGHLHIGTVRTALFNYLFARHHNGTFIFRSEDTDRARSTKEFEEEIVEGLAWLGLTHDGEMTRQSERLARHQELLEKVIAEGTAYISEEESKNTPGETVSVVRLKNPGKVITFHDEVRGDITFDTTELSDFVIARSVSDPLYHFAVVADDWDSGVTHVIRGEDHISNTPRQILIQEALGAPRPAYAHLPLILASDRSKMSKRHGAVALKEYREQGFIPEGIINYLALLGWGTGDDREDFTLPELVEAFDLGNVHKSGAVFDMTKFKSVNQRWLRKLSDEEFIARGELQTSDMDRLKKVVPLIKERVQTFGEARQMLEEELAPVFVARPSVDMVLIAQKGATKARFEALKGLMETLPEHPTAEETKEKLMPYADQEGRGEILWPLRYALSGKEKSPDPFTLVSIRGRDESVSIITDLIAKL